MHVRSGQKVNKRPGAPAASDRACVPEKAAGGKQELGAPVIYPQTRRHDVGPSEADA